MLLEVEVAAGRNSPLDLHRMFDLLSEPRPVSRALAPNPLGGDDLWCAVTGWGGGGPVAAMAALAEDSGEGVVLLLYGGDEGLRLQPAAAGGEWSLEDAGQWGEACLMLHKDTPTE